MAQVEPWWGGVGWGGVGVGRVGWVRADPGAAHAAAPAARPPRRRERARPPAARRARPPHFALGAGDVDDAQLLDVLRDAQALQFRGWGERSGCGASRARDQAPPQPAPGCHLVAWRARPSALIPCPCPRLPPAPRSSPPTPPGRPACSQTRRASPCRRRAAGGGSGGGAAARRRGGGEASRAGRSELGAQALRQMQARGRRGAATGSAMRPLRPRLHPLRARPRRPDSPCTAPPPACAAPPPS
jgi:hypothetical protein